VRLLPTNFILQRSWRPFLVWSPRKGLCVFFCKHWARFFEIKQRWSPFLPGFRRICPDFQGFYQDFQQIKTFGVELAPQLPTPLPSIMTNLVYCDKTRRLDIVTEQERSNASSTRHRPSHAIRKSKSLHTAVFQARRYYGQNLVRTTLSPRLWESDCDANNCCWGHVKIYKLLKLLQTAAHSDFTKLLRWPLVSDK